MRYSFCFSQNMCWGLTTGLVTCFSGLTLESIPLSIPCTSGKIMPLVSACDLV